MWCTMVYPFLEHGQHGWCVPSLWYAATISGHCGQRWIQLRTQSEWKALMQSWAVLTCSDTRIASVRKCCIHRYLTPAPVKESVIQNPPNTTKPDHRLYKLYRVGKFCRATRSWLPQLLAPCCYVLALGVVTCHLDMTVLSLNQDEQQNYKTVGLDMDIYNLE